MPRRDYDDDDDFRPRRRPRRRYEDEEDDYDDYPRRRRRPPGNHAPVVIGLIVGLFFLFALVGAGAYFAFRSGRQAPPPAFVNAPPPPVINANPMGPGPMIGGPMGPGGPMMGVPAGNEVTISNLRIEPRGLGGRLVLMFDYEFVRGRPFGLDYVAIVTQPGAEVTTFQLHFLQQRGTIPLDSPGGIGVVFRPGTTVYIGKQQFGPRGVPAAVSNTLTL